VLIYADQHRGGFTGAEGHPVVLTPAIDQLAAQGVLFPNSFTNGPSCRPGRAAMMTGRYIHDNGVWDNFLIAPSSSDNHVRDVRDAGYETAVIGKTHLHDDKAHTNLTQFILHDWGFDFVHELVGQNEQVWHETPYSDWLTANTPKGERDKYKRYNNYAQKYDWFSRGPDTPPWELTTDDHLDTYTGQVAADWLRDRTDQRPFYLQVNFPGPHKPFDATAEFRDLYDPLDIDPGILEVPSNPGRLVQTLLGWKQELFTPDQSRKLRLSYLAKCSLVDAAIAQVVEALDEIGELDNTWIIFTSDHGELLGDHALTGKIAFYEGSIRVPLVIRPPGGTKPWQAPGMVEQVDIPETIRHIVGLAAHPDTEGESLLDRVLAGPNGPTANDGREVVLSQNLQHTMVRTHDYKLVYDVLLGEPNELYDLVNDPEERNNLVADAAHEATRLQLIDQMLQLGAPETF
jgi:choline-sulfatase